MKLHQGLFLLFFAIVACSKNDPSPSGSAGTYLIMNGSVISLYDVANANVGAASYKPNAAFADVVIDNGTIYSSGKSVKTVDFINTKFYSLDKSPSYGKNISMPYKHLAVAAGKIFVSDMLSGASVLDRPASIKVLTIANPTKADSIGISTNGAIVSMVSSGTKVFISVYGYFVGDSFIKVVDANTNSVLSTIPLTKLCEQLSVMKDGTVLGLQADALVRIDPASFAVTTSTFFSKSRLISGSDATTLNGSSYAFDEDARKIYFLAPAIAGSSLSAYDFGTKTTTVLQNSYIPGSVIAYDSKNKTILVGSNNLLPNLSPDVNSTDQGALFFYSTSGELKQRITIPNNVDKILVIN